MGRQKTIAKLKEEYVSFYADAPVQKYAAMYIGKDEDTIIRWRKADRAFADAIQRARAEFVRKMILRSKAEFALERLEREVFGRKEVVIPIQFPAPMIYMPTDIPVSSVHNVAQPENLI